MKKMSSVVIGCLVIAACWQLHTTDQDQQNTVMKNTQDTVQVKCSLTTPELQKRKTKVIAVLKKQVLEKKELKNGYRYIFKGSDEMLDSVFSFIRSERACCGFFKFAVIVNAFNISIDITGPEGAKEMLQTELEL